MPRAEKEGGGGREGIRGSFTGRSGDKGKEVDLGEEGLGRPGQ